MIYKFLIWSLNKVFDGKNRVRLEATIKKLYRKMASEDLEIKSEIVKVKKGKTRYSVLYLETPEGKLKFNLGRYFGGQTVERLIPAN